MLVEWLDEAPVGTTFFYDWGCTEDTLLTSEVDVVEADTTYDVTDGLATSALGLLISKRCKKDLPVLDLKDCCCWHPYTSRSVLRAR